MKITHQYYTMAAGVNAGKMHKEAQEKLEHGEGSIVHEHQFLEPCNRKCKTYQ